MIVTVLLGKLVIARIMMFIIQEHVTTKVVQEVHATQVLTLRKKR